MEHEYNGFVCNDIEHMAQQGLAYLHSDLERRNAFRAQAVISAARYRPVEIMDQMMKDIGLG